MARPLRAFQEDAKVFPEKRRSYKEGLLRTSFRTVRLPIDYSDEIPEVIFARSGRFGLDSGDKVESAWAKPSFSYCYPTTFYHCPRFCKGLPRDKRRGKTKAPLAADAARGIYRARLDESEGKVESISELR